MLIHQRACFCAYLLLIGVFQFGDSRERVFGNNLDFVDHFIGTGGEGFGIGGDPPGAQVPFGTVRLSPDTVFWDNIFLEWNHFGGYYYGDDYIRLFSHTHMVGSGILDYGTIGVMPFNALPTADIISDYGFRSSFSHDNETAYPGYYSVLLQDTNIFAELSATTNAGVHRYTFNNDDDMYLLFDVSHSLHPDGCKEVVISVNDTEVSGYSLVQGGLSGRFGGIKTYFVAQFNRAISSYGVWNGTEIMEGASSLQALSGGAYVQFEPDDGDFSVEVFIGISFISIEQARRNLQTQVGNSNFDEVMNAAVAEWTTELNKFQVSGDFSESGENTVKFMSAVYHTLMSPTEFSESGGYYLGFDDQPHQLDEGQDGYYTDLSIWDVHRTQMPWLALFKPDVELDIIRSLLEMFVQGGDIPRWPLANGYTACMDGQHADIMIADAYFKNLTDFDIQLAYKGMYLGATEPRKNNGRTNVTDWINLGYIPFEQSSHGCCDSLAYAFDDWAIGNIAAALGYSEDAAMFGERSNNWKKVFNTEYNFMCPLMQDGTFNCPDTWINVFDERYIEGDAWHYRTFVPHDTAGLIEMFGGNDNFVEALDDFFYYGEFDDLNVLPNPYYWAGNEEDLFAVWQFNWANRPDLTQKYSRWLLDNRYSASPDGLPGNDDYGTMSAWLIFASLGFYPIAGTANYTLGSPLFGEVTFQTPRGEIHVIAHDNSETNVFVERVTLNGVNLTEPFVRHEQLFGSVFEFWMTDVPSSTYTFKN